MNIITGYRGEPHITSDQDRAKNQGAFGTGMYILDVGDQLASQIVSANEVRIRDGVLCMQGCVANITEGAYDTCEISNGTQGMQRRDLIVARYTKDAETNIEDISLVVIEGTPASSSPSDPSYNSGDIQQGDSPVDFPLYRVNINGVTISGTTLLATKLRTQAETDTLLGSSSISNVKSTITGAIGNTSLGTTATTLSGAIAEHESDISTLNSNKVNRSTSSTSAASISSGGSSYPDRVINFSVTNNGGDNKTYQLYIDKTFGFVLQNATDSYATVWTARAMRYAEYTATTGSTLYNNMYYVDKDVDSYGTIVGITPVDVASNRPAYAIAIGAAKIRIFAETASTSVKVRVIFSK